jgi:hypothetical protein
MTALSDLLAISDERDQCLRRLLAAERAAYQAGRRDGRDAERQRADRAWAAQAPAKAIGGTALAALEARRYGPGGIDHAKDPRPGDYPGGRLPHDRAGMVHLAGPDCHWHECTRACRAYRPGWYSYANAARIIATLPGGGASAGVVAA